jgi:hypothetical protein
MCLCNFCRFFAQPTDVGPSVPGPTNQYLIEINVATCNIQFNPLTSSIPLPFPAATDNSAPEPSALPIDGSLMRSRTLSSICRAQLELNARCIDFVHGGIYAWTYLSTAGFTDAEILQVLDAPPQTWCHIPDNVEIRARSALRAAGISTDRLMSFATCLH